MPHYRAPHYSRHPNKGCVIREVPLTALHFLSFTEEQGKIILDSYFIKAAAATLKVTYTCVDVHMCWLGHLDVWGELASHKRSLTPPSSQIWAFRCPVIDCLFVYLFICLACTVGVFRCLGWGVEGSALKCLDSDGKNML